MAQDSGHDERRSYWSGLQCTAGRRVRTAPASEAPRLTCRALREPCGALPPILNCDSPASALCWSGTSFGTGALLGPSRPLRFRHLTNHELPRRDLLAHVLEFRLPCLVISFPTRLRHCRSLPFSHCSQDRKFTANPRFLWSACSWGRAEPAHRASFELRRRRSEGGSIGEDPTLRGCRPVATPDDHRVPGPHRGGVESPEQGRLGEP
jgi:hypothetical protein